MDNAGEVFHFLEDFSKRKPKTIPQELNDYLVYVARTGDPVFQWALVKSLFKEKLINVITHFYDTTPSVDIPPYPNVDPFNYDVMKNSLLERLDSFTSAPFTVQRICELLTCPRKQYNRVDKFMRAIEKNILVVSTREPGPLRHVEPENGEPVVNGSDNNSDYNVDVEMEDMSCKETTAPSENAEPQPSSSDAQISVDDIQARLQAKQDTPMDTQEKAPTEYESLTPPEINVTESTEESKQEPEQKTKSSPPDSIPSTSDNNKTETITAVEAETTMDTEMRDDEPPAKQIKTIPDIKINDTAINEEKVIEAKKDSPKLEDKEELEDKCVMDTQQAISDQTIEDSKMISEVSTSSEESSSSSDNTDGNSNSPKDLMKDDPERSDTDDVIEEKAEKPDAEQEQTSNVPVTAITITEKQPQTLIQSDNYSITDVNSELPQVPASVNKPQDEPLEKPEEPSSKTEEVPVEPKTETPTSSETKDS